MKACAIRGRFLHWLADLLRLPAAESRDQKPQRPNDTQHHRHSAFLELP